MDSRGAEGNAAPRKGLSRGDFLKSAGLGVPAVAGTRGPRHREAPQEAFGGWVKRALQEPSAVNMKRAANSDEFAAAVLFV